MIHAVVDTNGLPVHLALTPGEAQDNRLCSVLLSALLPQTMLLADRGIAQLGRLWLRLWAPLRRIHDAARPSSSSSSARSLEGHACNGSICALTGVSVSSLKSYCLHSSTNRSVWTLLNLKNQENATCELAAAIANNEQAAPAPR
jgi:hypothetical protein